MKRINNDDNTNYNLFNFLLKYKLYISKKKVQDIGK